MLSLSKHAERFFRRAVRKENEMANRKWICPKCGDEMNHHADKLVYPTNTDELHQTHPDLGAVVEETHDCPGCGAVESRRAE
jgi:rubrerythrin